MSTFQPVNPMPFLQSLINNLVVIRLKWGQEYKGILVSTDQYMNVQIAKAEEFQDGNSVGVLPGELLIRCNNILYVREIVKASTAATPQAAAASESVQQGSPDSEDEQMEEGEQNP
ncbi:U6 snRNA-associated Sm-like protein LSm6 [Coemansia sp. RSA 1365]|nr:U6 snRNA-associated Sm-like protein LSm6 [Coemansia sp. RSA 1365]